MSTLRIGNKELFYSMSGKSGAPVLVLSNSLGTTHTMWRPQAELADRFQLLHYDTRGHGLSLKPKGPYTLAELGQDVLRLLDHLQIERAAFCGISMGGLTGQWLGVHASDRLSHLIIANTAARIGSEAGWRDRAATVRAHGMAPIAAGSAGRWFTDEFVQNQPDEVQPLIDALAQTDPEGYAACCEALATADLREEIARISTPTLIIAGSLDPVTTPADSDFMASRISGARRVDLPASHLSNIEAAKEFNAALVQFLAA